jgi:uncharacterized protein (DUF697 family)
MSRLRRTWNLLKEVWSPAKPGQLQFDLEKLRGQTPCPLFWLLGKTQSGKTSIIRYLTGAEDAAIGNGFRPCTKTSRLYPFPTAEAPALSFLDTRGVDEPGYDPSEDLAAFDDKAHLLLLTCRLTDFAHGDLKEALGKIRAANPARPVVLALTCLHEAYPQQQHPEVYPFGVSEPGALPEELGRLLAEQSRQFQGLVDRVVPIDFTKIEEGFTEPHFGGERLKQVLLELLPSAYRATFARLTVAQEWKESHHQQAHPMLVSYSTMAATAGALPLPFVDLLIIPTVQKKLVRALAESYGQPELAEAFLTKANQAGAGLVAQQALREVAKVVPIVGAASAASLAYASTYALGRAFCEYYQSVHLGHLPNAAQIRELYKNELTAAELLWKKQSQEFRDDSKA